MVQNLSQINADNLNNVGYEASEHFGNGRWKYLKENINESETYRNDIGDLNRGVTI
jgi:hypothetical protein